LCHHAPVTRIEHLSCATMCPGAARIPGLMPRELVAHCLVVEQPDGLVVVDTGFGTDDVREQGKRLGRAVSFMLGARFDEADTLLAQVGRLGYTPGDVRDIVVTHLDLDHAGGLSDFPNARVHVHATELQAALHPTVRERQRYIQAHWRHGPDWVEHSEGGDDWFGFGAVQAVGPDVLMVPLHGHTRGHCGVAVRRPEGGWFLHAGDAYFYTDDKSTPRSCPPGLRAFQFGMAVDGDARRANLSRLQELHAQHSDEVTVFCAHDRAEFEALAAG